MSRIDHLAATRMRFTKGTVLYRYGDGFCALYVIRTGSCKTLAFTPDGFEQIMGYHIVGEAIALDGIGSGVHVRQAVALEDMEVYALPFKRIDDLAHANDPFRLKLLRLLSQETSRLQFLATILATMRAEMRLASFLLDLSQRYSARGFSASDLVLRLTRQEIRQLSWNQAGNREPTVHEIPVGRPAPGGRAPGEVARPRQTQADCLRKRVATLLPLRDNGDRLDAVCF